MVSLPARAPGMFAETPEFRELSKSQSNELSEIFLGLAKARDDIARDLEKERLTIVSDAYVSVMHGFAETDLEKIELERYWREASYERLAALTGPYSLWNRKIPDFSSYRSSCLDEVVKKASAEFQTAPADPVLRRLMAGERRDELQKLLHERMTEARFATGVSFAEEAIGFMRSNVSIQDANWLDICEEVLSRRMDCQGFAKAETRKHEFTAYRRPFPGTNFAFVMLLDDLSDLEVGALNVSFLLAHKRTRIAPQVITFKTYATFLGHDLVPGINYAFTFRKFDVPQMLASASTAAALAGSIFTTLEDLLERSKAGGGD